ncbi:hypothetical protein BV898_18107 [Hypsibius exemplaris]|uniref:Serpin domain-containing protein n=1 Tax=Hypsibius exemplaris TaxID=2072580 RepID=A0A9X6NG91_HYPEX|nr:hypothetical protein BV898_18107 [Hypsibius exemplaris]
MKTLQMKDAATATNFLLRFPKLLLTPPNVVFRIFSNATASDGLHLSQITTRWFMTVNEDGLELATAESAVGAGLVLGASSDGVITVTIDSPFLFAVVNNSSPVGFDMGVLVGVLQM